MRVTRFNHVGLNAAGHHHEVREFYLSFLGMHDFQRNAVAARVQGFWAGADWPSVHIVTEPAVGAAAYATGTHISLFVDDIDAAVVAVKARTSDILHVGEGATQILWFKDPAGNTVELQQDPDCLPPAVTPDRLSAAGSA